MSSEFLLKNRLSNFSSASYSSNQSNGSHNNNRFSQAVIGHDFASNILVADLAIRSTAFDASPSSSLPTPTLTPPLTSINRNLNEKKKQENHDNSKKAKRRVTFNLDNVQVQTIPIYSSCSSEELSESDTSLEQEDDESSVFSPPYAVPGSMDAAAATTITTTSSPPPSTSRQQQHYTNTERISKKASYDALKQKQIRRRDPSTHFSASKPGYWYPLSPTSATRSSAHGSMARYGSPLPTLRSLEMTERLISESIQREMALNPNLLHHTATKRAIYAQKTTPPRSPKLNNDAVSMLITDTDDNEEDGDDEHEEDDHTTEEKTQNHSDKTGVAINDEQPNMRDSPESFSSVLIDDDEDEDDDEDGNDGDEDNEESDTSVVTSSPEPQVEYNQEKEQNETDFSKSVYNELAKRHNQAVIPFPEYEPPSLSFPFEQKLIPISASNDVVIIPPPSPSPSPLPLINNGDSVWIDFPSPADTTAVNDPVPTRDIFFVKVLGAENLDFPIDNGKLYISWDFFIGSRRLITNHRQDKYLLQYTI